MIRPLLIAALLFFAPASADAVYLVCNPPPAEQGPSMCRDPAQWGYRYGIENAPFTYTYPVASQADGSLRISVDDTPVGGPYQIQLWAEWTCNNGWSWQKTGKVRFRFSRTETDWPYLAMSDRGISIRGSGGAHYAKGQGGTGRIEINQATLSFDPRPSAIFKAIFGGANPAPQQAAGIQGLAAKNLSWTATVQSGAPEWLAVSPTSGNGDGTLTYSVDISGLYSKSINNGGSAVYGSGYVGIPVTGHGFLAGSQVLIAGTTNYNGRYNVLTGSTADQVRIAATYAGETFGPSATIRHSDQWKYVTITAPGAREGTWSGQVRLRLDPEILYIGQRTFTGVAGGANPATQTISIVNDGGGVMDWTATVQSGDPMWLSVDPASGSGDATVTLSVDTTGLAAGSYSKTITVTAPGAYPTVTCTVTLTLTAS